MGPIVYALVASKADDAVRFMSNPHNFRLKYLYSFIVVYILI